MLDNYKIKMIPLVRMLFVIVALTTSLCPESGAMEKSSYNKLTPAEEQIIVHKGTEPPFSGKYYDFDEEGYYVCKRCGARLYESTDKFATQCGWPSFDDAISGAVERRPDADGRRTEIICANCGAHLGHVFSGERLTEKNTRYCVNSLSLQFVPAPVKKQRAKAWFAGGCFWGVEYYFQRKDGVISAVSGYMGGTLTNPSYHDVCAGNSGHLETVEVTYNPAKISYEELVKYFFEIHDPTQSDGQGPDIGSQYHSAVFCANSAEKKVVNHLIGILNGKGLNVVTMVLDAGKFWPAEEYHQDHYAKKHGQPYCHRYQKRFD